MIGRRHQARPPRPRLMVAMVIHCRRGRRTGRSPRGGSNWAVWNDSRGGGCCPSTQPAPEHSAIANHQGSKRSTSRKGQSAGGGTQHLLATVMMGLFASLAYTWPATASTDEVVASPSDCHHFSRIGWQRAMKFRIQFSNFLGDWQERSDRRVDVGELLATFPRQQAEAASGMARPTGSREWQIWECRKGFGELLHPVPSGNRRQWSRRLLLSGGCLQCGEFPRQRECWRLRNVLRRVVQVIRTRQGQARLGDPRLAAAAHRRNQAAPEQGEAKFPVPEHPSSP